MKLIIPSVKGTRDYYPEDMAVRKFLYNTARRVSEAFGYQEWDGPMLETIDLYAAKSGEELVKEQSFVFPDRGGDYLTLRPELTPSLARLIAQRQKQLAYPLRWWSWGPFWRYERPQKGRTREFFQWNIDLIGVDTPEADAEMVAIAASFMQAAGISAKQVNILVNDRKLINSELDRLYVPPEGIKDVLRLIDRRDKMSIEEWQSYAISLGLSGEQFAGLLTMLADKELWQKSQEMVRLFAVIQSLGIAPYVRYAPHIIRGLDYYTSIVWEAWDTEGDFRAILGGGRYDNLVSDVGGDPLPATGFAMGDPVISLVLKKFNVLPSDLGDSPARVLVTIFDETSVATSFGLADQLRQAGINAACYPEASKLSKQFKYGDRMGMLAAVICGPDEQAQGSVALKDLRSGEQQTMLQSEMIQAIRKLLD